MHVHNCQCLCTHVGTFLHVLRVSIRTHLSISAQACPRGHMSAHPCVCARGCTLFRRHHNSTTVQHICSSQHSCACWCVMHICVSVHMLVHFWVCTSTCEVFLQNAGTAASRGAVSGLHFGLSHVAGAPGHSCPFAVSEGSFVPMFPDQTRAWRSWRTRLPFGANFSLLSLFPYLLSFFLFFLPPLFLSFLSFPSCNLLEEIWSWAAVEVTDEP